MIVKSLDHLNLISKSISKKLENGDCIFLIGEIGVGKTTFSRMLINSYEKVNKIKKSEVLSPTFNIVFEYKIKDFTDEKVNEKNTLSDDGTLKKRVGFAITDEKNNFYAIDL